MECACPLQHCQLRTPSVHRRLTCSNAKGIAQTRETATVFCGPARMSEASETTSTSLVRSTRAPTGRTVTIREKAKRRILFDLKNQCVEETVLETRYASRYTSAIRIAWSNRVLWPNSSRRAPLSGLVSMIVVPFTYTVVKMPASVFRITVTLRDSRMAFPRSNLIHRSKCHACNTSEVLARAHPLKEAIDVLPDEDIQLKRMLWKRSVRWIPELIPLASISGVLFFYVIPYRTQQLRVFPEKIDQSLYLTNGCGLDVMFYPFRILVGYLFFHAEHRKQF